MLNIKQIPLVYLFAILSVLFGTVTPQSSSIACSASSRPEVINSNKGWITSPNYPNTYNNSMDCQWLISSPTENTFVSVRFNYFWTETSYDFVTIYDGNRTADRVIARLSGTPTLDAIYSTTQRNMLLRFTTDISLVSRGFNATYLIHATDSQVACDRDLQPFHYSTDTGLILSANYPNNYNNDMSCQWLITARPDHLVRIRFTDFNTQSNHDYVYLHDVNNASSSFYVRMSGTPSSTNYTTSQRYLLVRFTSDSTTTRRGFNATFWTLSDVSHVACNRNAHPYNYTESTGVIMSQNYPNNYVNNADCRWLVTAAFSQVVKFQFSDLYTQIDRDYVTLYDGHSTYFVVLANLSGTPSLSKVYTTSQIFMLIQFKSDSYTTYRGFRGSFWTAWPDTSSSASLPDYAIAMIVIGSVALFMFTLVILNYKFHICDCSRKCRSNDNAEAESTSEVQPEPQQAPKPANATITVSYIASEERIVTNQNPMCNICMENVQNAVILPCRHGNFCIDCATRACSTNPHCPTCRQRVENIMQIYR